MTSSALKALGCFLLAVSVCVIAEAQNEALKKTGSISGKVTLKGNGVPGITVGAVGNRSNFGRSRFGAVTDSQGNYRISGLPAGTYELTPAAPQFVLASVNSSKNVIVDEGENLDGIDFTLLRGGVISGKVTNAEGQPLIEEPVHLAALQTNSSEPITQLNMYFNQTDDRGMYRAFGLAPGKYTVSAGTPADRLSFGGRNGVTYKQTYYPSVTDASQATVIEVTEGGETNNVDIVVSRREATYSVSGRIIDGETGRPIPNARYGLTKIEEHGSSGTSGPVTNALGEFKIENLTRGKYVVTFEPVNNDFYADGVRFEIDDHDVTDLVIKTSTGASVSGVLVFDGLDLKTAREKYGELMLMVATPSNERFTSRRNGPPAKVIPGSPFTITGLAAGEVLFMVFSRRGSEDGRNFEVARIERDGVVYQRSLEIKDREQVTGLRVVVTARTGVLQGIVKVENGTVEAGRMYLSLSKAGETNGYGISVDARGRFRIGGLSAGTYDITAYVYNPDLPTQPSKKQQVVITDDQVTEITVTIDLKARFDPDLP